MNFSRLFDISKSTGEKKAVVLKYTAQLPSVATPGLPNAIQQPESEDRAFHRCQERELQVASPASLHFQMNETLSITTSPLQCQVSRRYARNQFGISWLVSQIHTVQQQF